MSEDLLDALFLGDPTSSHSILRHFAACFIERSVEDYKMNPAGQSRTDQQRHASAVRFFDRSNKHSTLDLWCTVLGFDPDDLCATIHARVPCGQSNRPRRHNRAGKRKRHEAADAA